MPITHGAVRRASGAGPGWASFQTSGCLGFAKKKKKRETEIEAGKKIREEMQRQEIKDKRVREKMRRRREEKWRKKRRTGKGYEKSCARKKTIEGVE